MAAGRSRTVDDLTKRRRLRIIVDSIFFDDRAKIFTRQAFPDDTFDLQPYHKNLLNHDPLDEQWPTRRIPMHSYRMLLIILMTAFFAATNAYSSKTIHFGTYTSDEFQNYWYSRGAEISRFKLQQSRYGEIHDGDAVLVFVTEELNRAIQVKADRPGQQNVPVLKLNAVRKFFTGIYPYSIMTSIFAPINAREYPLPLKITSSTQEWCGQVYTQMNLGDGEYRVRSHSYFEEEGDQNFNLKKHVPEDAIWTMIRLAPQNLPRGDFFMIPGTVYSRLMHRALTPQKAVATLEPFDGKSLEGQSLVRYTIDFPKEQRSLRIVFEKDFPYRIQNWEDSHRGLRGMNSKTLTTRATRTHTIMNAYWQHHGNKDRASLKRLGLAAREMGGN
jgi:hypothetical protein